ncbi:MAG: phosphotransferase family protein, partial [Anaerolineales bacterium]
RVAPGEAVCHGDFHPGNVFLTSAGTRIIDWMDATYGNPLADVARSSFLLSKSVFPADMPQRSLIGLIRGIFHRTYLARYFNQLRPDPREWNAWCTLVAAARLAEDVPGERQVLIGMVKSGLGKNSASSAKDE